MKKRVLSFFTCLLLINYISAQPSESQKPSLDARFYISTADLNVLLTNLQTAPFVNEGCSEGDCEKMNTYYNALYNLREDVRQYYLALDASKNISKNQWFLYLDQTYKNENLKWALITNLRFKDAWAGASSFLLDVASGAQIFKAGNHISKKGIEKFLQILNDLDGLLSQINALYKQVNTDSQANILSSATSDDWANLYSGLKSGLDLLVQAVEVYNKVDASLTGSKLKKARISRGFAITAAVGQLLNIYSNYERKGMRDAIKELDKVLKPNQDVQTGHYDKYILKRKRLDILDNIRKEINLRYDGVFDLNLRCKGITKRKPRKAIEIGERKFGNALMYYKAILLKTTPNLKSAWKGIEECNEIARNIQFIVNDGLGKKRSTYIEIIRESDQKNLYTGSTSSKASILKLYPDSYTIEIYDGHTFDGIQSQGTTLKNLAIKATKDSIVTLSPYGRIELKVVDKEGKLQEFRYSFKNKENKEIAYAMTSSAKTVRRDLLAETFDLELSYKYNSEKEIKKNIKIQANQLNKLHFVYDDGTFTQEENPLVETVNESETSTSDFKPTAPKVAPDGWVSGTVYNTTNGSCDWKNKTLIFINQGGFLMNLATGEISKEITVLAGKEAKIAVPARAESSFLRVFMLDADGKQRISFWLLKKPKHNWWYAVGCNDGFGSQNTCNDGNGNAGCEYLPH
ncbi:hypothetical protein H2O64_16160 [Kordia sp. YSTF-M3]|uniref:Uncharacterized protein n=1 Tax=Kordia aestuariivivens TaxID=2759037 RepID=A0ABR7QCB7_9FLAO|nr:hypothetical protein [Kordia aestuariivivens]MBC8756212.1 hypothetical protein [Kordia aestuariivivens]